MLSLGWGKGPVSAKSGDIQVAALARAELLFLRWTLRATFATRPAEPAGAALALRRPHLLQLFELLGRENLLDLRLNLGFQGRHLFLLIVGQVQLLLRARRQDVKTARAAWSASRTALRAGFRRRTLAGRRRGSLILSG